MNADEIIYLFFWDVMCQFWMCWDYCAASKCWETNTQWCSITFQKIWYHIHPAARTVKLMQWI